MLGIAALFSGAALLMAILAQVSLSAALVGTSLLFALALVTNVAMARGPAERRTVLGIIASGLLAGVLATSVCDGTRALLSQVDPSPYNPFEVLRVFGSLLLGTGATPNERLVAGALFHLLNGTTFGLAYALLFGREGRSTARWAVATGFAWGVLLESFQLALYPGWLNITTYRMEFTVISAAAHTAYGLTLGLATRMLLRRLVPGGRSHERPAD